MKFIELIRNAFVDEDEKQNRKQNPTAEKPHEPIKRKLLNQYQDYRNIEDFSGVYLESPKNLLDVFLWPPNAFVVCAKFLDVTGVYKRVVTSQKDSPWTDRNKDQVKALGQNWSNFCLSDTKKNPEMPHHNLLELIYSIFKQAKTRQNLKDLMGDQKFINDILTLILTADESFKDIDDDDLLHDDSIASHFISQRLKKVKLNGERFCLSASQESYGTVHYKHFVCQSGISLNSLSHKLAYIRPDIITKYVQKRANKTWRSKLNLLIFPWPKVVLDDYFNPIEGQSELDMNEEFGFFEYSHNKPFDFDTVLTTIDKARRHSNSEIDVVVFPECAMSEENAKTLANKLYQHYQHINRLADCPTLVTGIFREGGEKKYGANALSVHYASQSRLNRKEIVLKATEQHKHHRWYLDEGQLKNYNLQDELATHKKWWEYIEVPHRSLISYYCEKHDYQLSPLICEDLARQDPVGPVLRALGPNLIIALLLDGPQLATRWPGRYASILADDPGAGVLSVTPLGMTKRADGTGFPPSSVVALWSDPHSKVELSLDDGCQSILLTLNKDKIKQWTADGRQKSKTRLKYARHESI